MNRGEVYYIDIPESSAVGHEIRFTRPGVIVSSNDADGRLPILNVVFLSTSALRHHNLPSLRHPRVYAKTESVAVCEQVTTVDESRIGTFICQLTDEEMERIDAGLADCLGLSSGEEDIDLREEEAEITPARPAVGQREPAVPSSADSALARELEVYKRLYADLLDRITKTA